MTDDVQIWLFAGGFGLIGVLFVLQWSHVRHCRAVGEAIARIDQSLADIKEHMAARVETLGERSHDQQQGLLKLDGRVSVLEERTK